MGVGVGGVGVGVGVGWWWWCGYVVVCLTRDRVAFPQETAVAQSFQMLQQ